MSIHLQLLVCLTVIMPACTNAAAPPAAGLVRFHLQCRPSNTASAAEVHCIRTDTGSGEIVKVEIFKLPVSQGATGASVGRMGRFQTECAAASTATKSDFYCVRLDTDTGEMMLINMQKLPPFPTAVK
jgi:hypothetical protein